MNLIKNILLKIGIGFLYGVGFMIAYVIIGVFLISSIQNMTKDEKHIKDRELSQTLQKIENDFNSSNQEYDESALLKVEVLKERINEDEFVLLGKITNNGESAWSFIQLKIELYDKSGALIDICENYVHEKLYPHKSINFKFTFTDFSKNDFQSYDSYKLFITDARFVY